MTNLAFIFQGGMGGLLGGLMPFLLIFGVFYFLIILPQRKRQKALADMVSALKPGDKVITNGGIRGTIISIKDDAVQLRVPPDNLRLEVARSSIASVAKPEEAA